MFSGGIERDQYHKMSYKVMNSTATNLVITYPAGFSQSGRL